MQGLITCGTCGLSYQGQYNGSIKRSYSCRGRLKVSHTDGSPRCIAPIFDGDWLEDKVWKKIIDILNDPNKLIAAIKDSLENLKFRQAELNCIIKPIDEKLAQIADKKAKLADQWVLSNMDPEKYKELQFNLNKEEMRLKSLRANIHPARLIELESVNETLNFWHNQFQSETRTARDSRGGVKLLEKTKFIIGIYGFEDIDPMESMTSLPSKRQILDKLQVKLVVFNDRIEVKCQIPIEPDKSTNVIFTLGL